MLHCIVLLKRLKRRWKLREIIQALIYRKTREAKVLFNLQYCNRKWMFGALRELGGCIRKEKKRTKTKNKKTIQFNGEAILIRLPLLGFNVNV